MGAEAKYRANPSNIDARIQWQRLLMRAEVLRGIHEKGQRSSEYRKTTSFLNAAYEEDLVRGALFSRDLSGQVTNRESPSERDLSLARLYAAAEVAGCASKARDRIDIVAPQSINNLL